MIKSHTVQTLTQFCTDEIHRYTKMSVDVISAYDIEMGLMRVNFRLEGEYTFTLLWQGDEAELRLAIAAKVAEAFVYFWTGERVSVRRLEKPPGENG